MMTNEPADPYRAGDNQQSGGRPAQSAGCLGRQRPECHAASPREAAPEPEQQKDAVDEPAKRVPVQRFAPLPMPEADKGAGQAAAGAREAGQVVKRADGRQMAQMTLAVRQRQQDTGRDNRGEHRPYSAGIGSYLFGCIHARGGRGCRGVGVGFGGGGHELTSGGGPVMAAFHTRFSESCCKTGLINPKLPKPPNPTKSRIL